MCGRFAFFSPAEAVRRVFGALDLALLPPPRWNIAPTQPVAVIRLDAAGLPELLPLRWGLIPSWARDASIGARMINARSETVAEKPAFRHAFRRRRCLVLADGWYEWQQTPRGKQPWFLRPVAPGPFAIAGLWEHWQDPAGGGLASCTLLTTAAEAGIASIHDRMPVLLDAPAREAWLAPAAQPGELLALLRPLAGVAASRVSRAVNDARHDGPDLVRPLPEPDPPA